MRHLLTAIPTTLALAVSGLALTASPAAAEYATTVGELSTETPGHVTGTVTSDAPALRIAATNPAGTSVDQVDLANPDGSVEFDLETWGLSDGRLAVSACDAGFTACTSEAPVAFTAGDIVPTVVFPEDTTIGQEDYVVTVADPDGGGVLRLRAGGFWGTTLPSDGPSEPVHFTQEGAQSVVVFRCAASAVTVCRATGLTRDLVVNRKITASTHSSWDVVSTQVGTPYETTVSIQDPETSGAVDLTWELEVDGAPVEGYGGTVSLVRDASNQVHPSLDLAGLPEGHYDVFWTPSTTTEEFGTVTGTRSLPGHLRVDNTAPPVNRIAIPRNNVYPYRDGYRDVATIKVFPGYVDDDQTVRVDIIRKANGKRVRILHPGNEYASPMLFRWNGRNGAGNSVPGGQYQIRVRAWDKAGNLTRKLMSREITVVRKKLAARTLNRTVTPGYSMIDKYVGACSTLRRPALRGWRGSLGLYSNTTCSRGDDPSIVDTTHATRLPRAAKYGAIRVSLYGGAATARPDSRAVLTYWNAQAGSWMSGKVVGPGLRTHAGPRVPVRRLMTPQRWVFWSAWTGFDNRYDVKTFTVRMNYWVLVSDS